MFFRCLLVVPLFHTISIVFLSPCQNCDICEIWTRVWYPFKIMKYCRNCGIWSILRLIFKIEKSGQNCKLPHWQFPLKVYLQWVCLIFLFISEIIKNMFVGHVFLSTFSCKSLPFFLFSNFRKRQIALYSPLIFFNIYRH